MMQSIAITISLTRKVLRRRIVKMGRMWLTSWKDCGMMILWITIEERSTIMVEKKKKYRRHMVSYDEKSGQPTVMESDEIFDEPDPAYESYLEKNKAYQAKQKKLKQSPQAKEVLDLLKE